MKTTKKYNKYEIIGSIIGYIIGILITIIMVFKFGLIFTPIVFFLLYIFIIFISIQIGKRIAHILYYARIRKR